MERVHVKHFSGSFPDNPKTITLIDFLIKKVVEKSINETLIRKARKQTCLKDPK